MAPHDGAPRRWLAALALTTTVVAGASSVALAQEAPPSTTVPTDRRTWLVAVPTGCEPVALPDVVFVGTLLETGTPSGAPQESAYQTGRFRVDQARAGEVGRYAYDGVVDVRFGTDAKFLEDGEQYLIGASFDEEAAALVSKVREPEPSFGGDEVIGAAENDVSCPDIEDPVRAMRIDGTPIDAGVISPLTGAKRGILRSMLLPLAIAFAVLFVLVSLRWLITGAFKGVGAVVSTASVPREKRAAMRSRPRHQRGPVAAAVRLDTSARASSHRSMAICSAACPGTQRTRTPPAMGSSSRRASTMP